MVVTAADAKGHAAFFKELPLKDFDRG